MARRRGPAFDLEHLQRLLDRFRARDNAERLREVIGNQTPAERYLPAPGAERAPPSSHSPSKQRIPTYEPHSVTRTVWGPGVVGYEGFAIALGRRYRGATVRILEVGELLDVYLGDELIRVVALDRGRRDQERGSPNKQNRPTSPRTRCLT